MSAQGETHSSFRGEFKCSLYISENGTSLLHTLFPNHWHVCCSSETILNPPTCLYVCRSYCGASRHFTPGSWNAIFLGGSDSFLLPYHTPSSQKLVIWFWNVNQITTLLFKILSVSYWPSNKIQNSHHDFALFADIILVPNFCPILGIFFFFKFSPTWAPLHLFLPKSSHLGLYSNIASPP